MATGKTLVSVSIKAYAVYTVSMIVGCTILTTIIYKAQGGPKVIPLISDTWVDPPGSYISRWMIGNGSGSFALVNIGLYFIEGAAGGHFVVNPKLILAFALFGTFLLSWVGAICENDKPTCMGNVIIHSVCAFGFFMLYDLSMLLTYLNRRKHIGEQLWGFGMILTLISIALTLTITMSRFLLPDKSVVVGNILFVLAVFEWINVSIVWVLTIHCVFTAQGVKNYGVGFLDRSMTRVLATGGKDVSLVWSVSAYDVSLVCGALYLSTLVVSCAAGLYFGYLPKVKGEFWCISDMWVNIPGDWISRWGGVQGTHMGYLMQICLFFVTNSKSRQTALIISLIALFGLSVVSVCNEKENLAIHSSGAVAYFCGYDIFILLTLFDNSRRLVRNQDLRENIWILISSVFGTVAVLSHLWRLSSDGKIIASLAALLEWINAIAIICFAFSDVRAHSDCAGYVFGIFHDPREVKAIHGAYELMKNDSRNIKPVNFV